jgi:hypothetical protein
MVEEALRAFCAFGSAQGSEGLVLDWAALLPLLEYAYNSSRHSTTGEILFEVDIGRVSDASLSSIAQALGAPNVKDGCYSQVLD